LPPDIAIEIISPSERSAYSERKVWKYLETGVQELWQVMPAVSRVMIFRPGATIADVPHIDDTLTTSLLPGWELPLREIFSV
jgi:Uma2 family endonuclease